MVAEALTSARAVQDASHRVIWLGKAARHLRELGDADRADKLLREAAPVAKKLSTSGWSAYARGAFAEELAALDLPGALELIKDLKDAFEYDRHHGNIAHRLGGTRPADAERVLGLLGKKAADAARARLAFEPFDTYAPRVVYRMAPADLDRARRLADRVADPGLRAQSLGVMALAVAKTRPDAAAELLRRAFGVLAAHVAAGKDEYNGMSSAAVVALSLVPIAEAIDPGLAPEFFWRALALRPQRPVNLMHPTIHDSEVAAVALFAARYDRALARSLLEPLTGRALDLLKAGHVRAFLPALVQADPRRAFEVYEGMANDPLKDGERPRLAKLLLLDGDERWRDAHNQAGLWFVDDEDQ